MKSFLLIFVLLTVAFGLPTQKTGNSIKDDSDDPIKKTLLEWVQEIEEHFDSVHLDGSARNTDRNCIANKLKLAENSQKEFNEAHAITLYGIGMIKCQKGSTEEQGLAVKVERLLKSYKTKHMSDYKDCYLKELQKLDPNSKFLKNFDASSMDHSSSECKDEIDDDRYAEMIKEFEEQTGPLETFTCGVLNSQEIKKFGLTAVVAANEEDEELKSEEITKLNVYLMTKLNEIFDCLLNGS